MIGYGSSAACTFLLHRDMLQTLTKEKLSSVLNRGREPREDTVFGALFGSVAYADLVTTGLMLDLLLGETFSFDADITRVNVELWPSRMLDGRRVEPAVLSIWRSMA